MQFNMLLTLLLSIIGLAAASPAFGLATSTTTSGVTTTLAITSGSKLTIPGPLIDLQNEAIDACKDWCIHDACGDYRGTDMYGQCVEPCINSRCLRELATEIAAPPARRQIDSCDDLCHYVCKDKPYDECEGPCVKQNCGFTQFTNVAQRAVATETASLAPQPTTVPVPGCQDRVSATPPVATPTTTTQSPSPTDEVIGRRDMPADCSVQCKYICGNSLECIPSCMANCESRALSNKAAVDASSDIAGGIRRRDVPTDCSVHCKYVCGNSPECLPSCIANCESTTLSKAAVDASPRVTGAVRRGDVSNDCSIHCKYVCGNSPECLPSCIASCESAPPGKVAGVVRRRVSRAQPPSSELARRQDDALVQCEKQCLDETCGESNPDCVDTCVQQCMADGPFATTITGM